MRINKNAVFSDFDEFLKVVQKLRRDGITFNFNGNVDTSNDTQNFSVNWTEEEEFLEE